MKKHRVGTLLIGMGAMLLLAALSLVLFNYYESKKCGDAAQETLEALKSGMAMQHPAPAETTAPPRQDLFQEYESTTTTIPVEPVLVVDAYGYIGFVTMPTLNLELPVMAEWNDANLKLAPCRYKGTAAAGDMIIAAHNYVTHFGKIRRLTEGDPIIFTDVNGNARYYEVSEVEEIAGRDIAGMDFGAGDSWDLTLFTCTIGGQSRITIRAQEQTDA